MHYTSTLGVGPCSDTQLCIDINQHFYRDMKNKETKYKIFNMLFCDHCTCVDGTLCTLLTIHILLFNGHHYKALVTLPSCPVSLVAQYISDREHWRLGSWYINIIQTNNHYAVDINHSSSKEQCMNSRHVTTFKIKT